MSGELVTAFLHHLGTAAPEEGWLNGCEPAARRVVHSLRKAAATESLMSRLRARWRGTGPDLLNDLPPAVWLALEDNNVAAFGGDFSTGGDDG